MARHLISADSFDTVREDFQGMIRVAWWAVWLTTGTGLLVHWTGWLPLDLPGILVAAGCLQLNCWAALRLATQARHPLRLYFAAHLLNILVVTFAIHSAGGIAFGPGPILYALIVVNGASVGSRPAHVLAFGCTVAYAALVALDVYGVLPGYRGPHGPIATVQPRAWPAFVAIVGVVMHIIAAYAGRLTELVRARGAALIKSTQRTVEEIDRRCAAQAAAERAESDAEELRDLTQRYRTFVQMTTHDLKNPINVIYLTAEQLLGRPDVVFGSPARAGVERIRDMAAGAEAMIFDLMNLFRVVSKRETSTWVALSDLVQEAVATFRDTTRAKRVRVDVAPSLPMVWGQPDKLLSAVTNVVSNAIKYVSRDHGCIRISGASDEQGSVLTIEDNGIGIPPEYRERIFELFARLPETHQQIDGEQVQGTGVGLALARRIMDLHRGTVTVHDADVRGSRFELRFPHGRPLERRPDVARALRRRVADNSSAA